MAPRKDFVIGLDPGVQTGLCCYHRPTKKIIQLKTLDFWTAYDYVKENFETDKCIIVIERPIRPIYKGTAKADSRGFVRDTIAVRIGENRKEALLLIEGFKRLGYEVRACLPSDHKWSAEEFKRITGCAEKTNQHERDGAQLVFGL